MYSSANRPQLNFPTMSKSVLSERQTSYNPSEQIIVRIPATMGMMNPQETYLKFRVKVKNTGDQPLLASLDGRAGAYSVFERLDVYSGLNSAHLEVIEGVANLMATYWCYSNDPSQEGRRVLAEGAGGPVVRRFSGDNDAGVPTDAPNSNPLTSNGMLSPYFDVGTAERTGASPGITYRDVEVCLPLLFSGIFSSKQLWSLMASDGLELRFTLRNAEDSIVAFDGYGFDLGSHDLDTPVPHDAQNEWTANNMTNVGADGGIYNGSIDNGGAVNTRNCSQTNCYGVYQSEDSAGAFAGGIGGGAGDVASVDLMNNADILGAVAGGAHGARPVNSVVQFPGMVGQYLAYQTTAGGINIIGPITKVALVAGRVRCSMAPATNVINATAVCITYNGTAPGTDGTMCLVNGRNLGALNANVTEGRTYEKVMQGTRLSYEVNDVQLVLGTAIVPEDFNARVAQAMESDGLVYEYSSWDLYRLQDNKSIKTSLLVPTIEGRAKSLVVNPVISNIGSGGPQWFNSALQPNQDSLKSYIWLLGNTLVPDLELQTLKSNTLADGGIGGFDVMSLMEADKAMERADIPVRDLRNFHDHFTAGRRLSTDDHSYDAKSNEIRLNLQYNKTPTVDKQWYAWMSHIRRCIIRPEGIEVVY